MKKLLVTGYVISVFLIGCGGDKPKEFDLTEQTKSIGIVSEKLIEDNQANIEKFFRDLAVITRWFDDESDRLTKFLSRSRTPETRQAFAKETMSLIEQTVYKTNSIPTPASCLHYRQLVVGAYQQMLATQKMSAGINEMTPALKAKIEQAFEEAARYITESKAEYTRILKNFNITDQEW